MLFEEWNWEEYVAVQREEGREEGAVEMLSKMVHTMSKTSKPEEIAKALELPLMQVQAILNPALN